MIVSNVLWVFFVYFKHERTTPGFDELVILIVNIVVPQKDFQSLLLLMSVALHNILILLIKD